jgi:hypothetical protein
MDKDNKSTEVDNTDKKLHISDVSCRSLLDDLLNHCDLLINGNKDKGDWSESFNNGVYAVRGKVSHLRSKLNDN